MKGPKDKHQEDPNSQNDQQEQRRERADDKALERLRQFEEERGLEPSDVVPPEADQTEGEQTEQADTEDKREQEQDDPGE